MWLVELIIKLIWLLQCKLTKVFDQIIAVLYIILWVIIKTHYLALVRKTEFTPDGSKLAPLFVWLASCLSYIIITLIVDPQDKPFSGLLYFKWGCGYIISNHRRFKNQFPERYNAIRAAFLITKLGVGCVPSDPFAIALVCLLYFVILDLLLWRRATNNSWRIRAIRILFVIHYLFIYACWPTLYSMFFSSSVLLPSYPQRFLLEGVSNEESRFVSYIESKIDSYSILSDEDCVLEDPLAKGSVDANVINNLSTQRGSDVVFDSFSTSASELDDLSKTK